jgi:Mg-chelatase subunit ChlD
VPALDRLDLMLCVDVTGSMGPFIAAAKAQVASVLEALQARIADGLRVGVIGYRDHSDQRLMDEQPLTTDLKRCRKAIDAMVPAGGGDGPEAVFAALERCRAQKWGKGAYRVVILVADAPPHSVGAPGDAYPNDPTGLSLDDVANALEADGVFVHALSMQPHDRYVKASFERLSISTGGRYHDATSPTAAVDVVKTITAGFLDDLDFDAKLLAVLKAGVTVADDGSVDEAIAKRLSATVPQVWGGQMRLRRRGLI